MKLIDSHAHLMDEMYQQDVEEVIKRCLENDIEFIVNIGYDKESSLEAVQFANQYDFMYAAVGLHPDACNESNIDLAFLKELAKNKKVVAIGEIGLDYHYDETNRDNQKDGFIKQIQLANELSLPVAIHSRDADMDTLKILKENKIENGFVMHCFSSSVEIAKEILKLGGYISLAGTVTFKNARNPKEVADMVPLDKLLVETDSPYLTPEPFRGKRNEPWHVWETAKKIAEIKNISLEEFVNDVNHNIRAFYRI
ncbi:MAG: TatD family hydrolase [Clostridia bacterium]|nr:TatD family hydrolase [Clostridia bacterium]